MKTYTIEDLLVGQVYHPVSRARRYQGGEITHAEKRENVDLAEGWEAYAIKFNGHRWATVAVKVSDL